MIKPLCLIAVLLSSILCKSTYGDMHNPFIKPSFVICQDQENALLQELSQWHYHGYVAGHAGPSKGIPTIWLSDKQQWLKIQSSIPNPLQHWRILDISSQYIMWQTDLVDYCHKTLTFNMPFMER